MFQEIKNLIISFDVQETTAQTMAMLIHNIFLRAETSIDENRINNLVGSYLLATGKDSYSLSIEKNNNNQANKITIEDIPEIENKVLVQEESKKRGRKKQLS